MLSPYWDFNRHRNCYFNVAVSQVGASMKRDDVRQCDIFIDATDAITEYGRNVFDNGVTVPWSRMTDHALYFNESFSYEWDKETKEWVKTDRPRFFDKR